MTASAGIVGKRNGGSPVTDSVTGDRWKRMPRLLMQRSDGRSGPDSSICPSIPDLCHFVQPAEAGQTGCATPGTAAHAAVGAMHGRAAATNARVAPPSPLGRRSRGCYPFHRVSTASPSMQNRILALGLLLAGVAAWPARADELSIPTATADREQAAPAVVLPTRGATQAAVVKTYGQPTKRYPAVGGASPVQPPITRWDYPGFSVFFENAHVVDAVVPGRPAQIFHADQLKTTAN
ncbi:hypothetical protein [Nevskia sp.]|uniref:hypothetical protein n=1 Tax=Nevskia sp. TaxID=1929292 RepID=UPI0025EB909B|nr:hypothetical protein [Nevskia sp.]